MKGPFVVLGARMTLDKQANLQGQRREGKEVKQSGQGKANEMLGAGNH
jgi:hypothetical protein